MKIERVKTIFGVKNAELVKSHFRGLEVEYLIELAMAQYSDEEIYKLVKNLTAGHAPIAIQKEVEWVGVESSNIAKVRYFPNDERFDVSFLTGNGADFYSYLGLNEEVFNDFMESDSKGSYFCSEIKGQYKSMKSNETQSNTVSH